jgi:hypothetical protein
MSRMRAASRKVTGPRFTKSETVFSVEVGQTLKYQAPGCSRDELVSVVVRQIPSLSNRQFTVQLPDGSMRSVDWFSLR